VPLILDLMKTERERQAMRLIVLDTLVAWPLVAPAGTPDAKVAELRAAFVNAMADPGVLEDTRKAARSSDMVSGEAIEKAIADVYATPADVVAFAKGLLAHK